MKAKSILKEKYAYLLKSPLVEGHGWIRDFSFLPKLALYVAQGEIGNPIFKEAKKDDQIKLVVAGRPYHRIL